MVPGRRRPYPLYLSSGIAPSLIGPKVLRGGISESVGRGRPESRFWFDERFLCMKTPYVWKLQTQAEKMTARTPPRSVWPTGRGWDPGTSRSPRRTSSKDSGFRRFQCVSVLLLFFMYTVFTSVRRLPIKSVRYHVLTLIRELSSGKTERKRTLFL